jgi:hypothetical protein
VPDVPAPGPEPIPSHAWRILVVAGLGSTLPAITLSVMYVVYPELQKAFPGVSSAQLSWVLNS